jgi:enamine deaminase RidA (YjgF/YER057c/UK114 family)
MDLSSILPAATVRCSQSAEPRENHVTAIKRLLIGGLIIMTMGTTATTANENDLRLTIVNPQNLYDPTPNGYSTAVIMPHGARVAYISGQGGQDSTGALSPDFAIQVQQAYANLRTALDALGAKPDQVAKLTVFVVDHDMSKLEVLTKNVKEMFGEALPAQTLIPVSKLAIDPMLFEVEAVVVLH